MTTRTRKPDPQDFLAAVREVGWVAREAMALQAEGVSEDTERWREYSDRKRVLLALIEADRATR
jgi:hypothetical protein